VLLRLPAAADAIGDPAMLMSGRAMPEELSRTLGSS